MRKNLCPLLVTLSLLVAAPAWANGPKTLAVVSLASYNQSAPNDSVGLFAGAAEMPTWMSSMLKLYAEGRDVDALDKSRPWGAVIAGGDKMTAYGFLPVRDAESLAWELDEYIESVTEVGNGIQKVVGTEAGKTLYAKEQDGWLFVSSCEACLETVPANPTALLDGMDKEYDMAVRLLLKKVPADTGHKILAELDKTIGAALRKMTSDQTVEILGEAAFKLDEVTLGWGG